MTGVINAEIMRRGQGEKEVVVVMGDVDEIPRREAVGILRECAWEDDDAKDGKGGLLGKGDGWGKIHLQLRQYLYSFEFPTVSFSTLFYLLLLAERKLSRDEAHPLPLLLSSSSSAGLRILAPPSPPLDPREVLLHALSVQDRVLVDSGWHCS